MKLLFTVLLLAVLSFGFRYEQIPEKAVLDFQEWFWNLLKEESPKLSIGYNEALREYGVYATTDIKADEELFRIPSNLMLRADRIMEITPISEIIDAQNSLTDVEIIASYLAYLKVCQPEINPWAPWLTVLPKRYNSILYFNNEEMRLIEDTSFEVKAKEIRDRAKTSFDIVAPLFKKETENFKCDVPLLYDDWRWAVSTVRSRKIEAFSQKGTFIAVMPFFDFFNHIGNSDKYSWGYSTEHNFFHTEALKSYRAGDEVFQFYGHLSNWELMLDYGFTLEKNENDYVLVESRWLGVDPQDISLQLKEKLLEPYRKQKADKLRIYYGNVISKELLNAAQVISSAEEDFIDEKLGPKTPLTDLYMAMWFQAVCTEKLSGFKHSLADDQQILRTSAYSAMSWKAQMAIQTRMAEKQLLIDTKNFWKAYEQDMSKLIQDAQNKEEL